MKKYLILFLTLINLSVFIFSGPRCCDDTDEEKNDNNEVSLYQSVGTSNPDEDAPLFEDEAKEKY